MSTFVIKAMESLQTATGQRPTQRRFQQFKILTLQLVGTGKLTVCTITDMITRKKARMQSTSRKFSAILAFSNLNTCSQELIIKRRLDQPYRASLPVTRFKTFPFWAPLISVVKIHSTLWPLLPQKASICVLDHLNQPLH